jgi:hypothetical protein
VSPLFGRNRLRLLTVLLDLVAFHRELLSISQSLSS